ncbi:hypothetical protein MVEN_01914300 [Mycena venus]|uniref:Uncharacterized protein n=1 Tax=Mycena venus TaxID=2733690 RepID=A0A8H6XG60_9AGAR|nr:hypothetical protein MVEN_01914300 [Mycena venus]
MASADVLIRVQLRIQSCQRRTTFIVAEAVLVQFPVEKSDLNAVGISLPEKYQQRPLPDDQRRHADPVQPSHVPPIPMPPIIVNLPPVFDTLMEILRETRLAQLATIDQQRELMRYMTGLNEWLERGVYDRQAELHGVVARVDQLREEMRAISALGVSGPPDGSESGSSDESPVMPQEEQEPVIPPAPWPLGFQPFHYQPYGPVISSQ